MKRNLIAALFCGIAAGGSATYYGLQIEPQNFQIQEYAVQTSHIQENHSGLKVAVLSDLHTGSRFIDIEHIQNIVTAINAQNPDLVLIPGDIINAGNEWGTHYDDFTEIQLVETLSQIKAPTVASFGNHEYLRKKKFRPDQLIDLFKSYGIPILHNEARAIKTAKGDIWIAGLDDHHKGTPDYAATMANMPDEASIIYMSHNPDGFQLLDRPVSIAIAGDTHCGQINIFGILLALYKRNHIETLNKWSCGLYDDLPHDNQGLVSSGIGTSTLPIRIGAPPQVELLTLEHAQP